MVTFGAFHRTKQMLAYRSTLGEISERLCLNIANPKKISAAVIAVAGLEGPHQAVAVPESVAVAERGLERGWWLAGCHLE